MTSYHQCKSCNKFVISSDPVETTKHASMCFLNINSTIDDAVKVKEEEAEIKREIKGLIEDNFHRVTFSEVRIHLPRCQSPPLEDESRNKEIATRLSKKECRAKKIVKSAKKQQKQHSTKKRQRNRDRDPVEEPFIRNYRYDCDQCPGRFYSKVEFDRHMNVHTGTRKTMKCIVCLRMFNKRDSLNQHYASHENSEERQENLDLMHSWPKQTSGNQYARIRQACKYCLLVHTNQASFVSHMNSEHGGDKSVFPCGLDKCPLKFSKIRDLLQHAKETHPLSFYGKFTLKRLTGAFIASGVGSRRGPNGSTKGVQGRKVSKKVKSRKKKRKMSFSDSESEEEVMNFTGTSTRTRTRTESSDIERTVELERVHIVDGSTDKEGVTVKKEDTRFYSTLTMEPDPFLLQQCLETPNNLPIKVEQPDHVSDYFQTDSVPIVLGIKNEPII